MIGGPCKPGFGLSGAVRQPHQTFPLQSARSCSPLRPDLETPVKADRPAAKLLPEIELACCHARAAEESSQIRRYRCRFLNWREMAAAREDRPSPNVVDAL